ncbi:MAG: biotin--[acetyl-CoA-carboxylase] ligase [Anaerolineales bacterium]|nr:biotin--[acetyl-CoA-carboxylase] ligase [Anaerolineales bacterium]
MQAAEFARAVAGLPLARAEFFAQAGSTNDIVAGWAAAAPAGVCVAAADEQTAGRGRAGRHWHTPPGSALALSLLLPLPPSFASAQIGRVSGLGALAVNLALESFGLATEIKWPNDVLAGGKKLCGVLPEAQWNGSQLQAVILGIGINIAASAVPDEATLSFPATSVEQALGRPLAAGDLLRAVLQQVLAWLPGLAGDEFLQAWEQRLAYRGQAVDIVEHGTPQRGTLLGLAPDGGLRLLAADGSQRNVQAGQVQLRPAVDSASN